MRKYKIIVDCSANLINKDNVNSVPLSITLGDKIYVDTDYIDVLGFIKDMEAYKGKSTSACPNTLAWIRCFDDADEIYAISLTSKLSGCYNSLRLAKDIYLETHRKKIMIFDTLTTGPELVLIVEKIQELIDKDYTFEEICDLIYEYKNKTHLMFMLKNLENFAKNGRVNQALAKIVKLLHISIVGQASLKGDLEPLNKCRGEKNGLIHIFKNMKEANYKGGKVRISHTENLKGALFLKNIILKEFPNANITITANKALCAYYTERNGILVGFEE
jgi:DegV family protein with EDD domain